MLQVWFSDVKDNLINNHEKIDFGKAVELTNQLEMKCRNEKKSNSSEFTVIDAKTNESLYEGIFNFGSYDYPNIYHQIKDKANKIKVDKKRQADKDFLLEKIEELTPDEMKREENIDKTLINVDKENISKLKRWQRRTVYSLAGLFLLISVFTVIWSVLQMASYEKALNNEKKQLNGNEELIEHYEKGLLGNREDVIQYLNSLDELSENQEVLLVNHFIDEEEYAKAVEKLGDDSRVETMILMNDNYDESEKVEKINAFNEEYSTNEARYDLAYFDKDYELMLNIQDVDMVLERSKMKTLAHLRLDELDEAKAELNNNNDDEMKEKVNQYEGLTTEIETLEEKIDKADKKEKKELEKELKEKKEEKSEI